MELFAFDVDGTLVKADTPLSPLTVQELNKHLKKGDAVAIASGRPISGAFRYLKELTDSPLKFAIGANGSEIESFSGEVLGNMGLTYSQYLYLHELCKSPKRTIYTYIHNSIGTLDFSSVIDSEYRWNRMDKVIDFNKNPLAADGYITKIVICSAPEDSANLEHQLAKADLKGMRMVRSAPIFLEFLNPIADKKAGVQVIADKYHLTKEHVHTFGDAMNDYYMIKEFDGTAMGNAVEEVKKVAKRVTKTVDEDGVGYALKTWFSVDD